MLPDGLGLLGALSYFGLDSISVAEKTEWRNLAIRGAPFTEQEKIGLIAYCEQDVVALPKLLGRMIDRINLSQALHRGRYQRAIAHMEWNGIPIDTERLKLFRDHWDDIKLGLIEEVDSDFHVYEGTTFKLDRFALLLHKLGIKNWPLTNVGRLSKSDESFKEMCVAYPKLRPLKELNFTLTKLRLERLAVGADGRNRTPLWAFGTKTGRNTPKASEFIFGQAAWLRSLIKPNDGCALAYIDWSAQEFAIAAVLSGDPEMIQNYLSGDPYLAFAKAAGAVPQRATKQSHPQARAAFKQCALAVLYGMHAEGFATYSGQSLEAAEAILEAHRRVYRQFWIWSDRVVELALLRSWIQTSCGWRFRAPWKPSKPDPKHRTGIPIRTIQNFRVQATAAEMFRWACCLMIERGVRVCAPLHDAVLIEAPVGEIDHWVSVARAAMAQASRDIFRGKLELRTDARIFTDRFIDERGGTIWETVNKLAGEASQGHYHYPQQSQQMELGL